MKYLAIVLLLVVYTTASAIQSSEAGKVHSAFEQFIQRYGKKYTNEEYAHKFANFKSSLARSGEKNLKSKTAEYGITKFSDLSPEEFKSTILMKNPIVPTRPDKSQILPIRAAQESLPATFDWRDSNVVTAVKNQEQCGSCWAFSATENVESVWIIGGKGNLNNTDFAPQQIVDCDTTDDGCDGGEPSTAYEYLISAGGIESEQSYPYIGEDQPCNFNAADVVGKISSWQYATDWYSETTLQNNLVNYAPLSICVDALAWQDYISGVMTWEECAWINELDHCVQLVGYDTTNTTAGPYWIVRNSWAADWGIDGYIYLQMWEDTCGLTYDATTTGL